VGYTCNYRESYCNGYGIRIRRINGNIITKKTEEVQDENGIMTVVDKYINKTKDW
jgi:hypothetical protein